MGSKTGPTEGSQTRPGISSSQTSPVKSQTVKVKSKISEAGKSIGKAAKSKLNEARHSKTGSKIKQRIRNVEQTAVGGVQGAKRKIGSVIDAAKSNAATAQLASQAKAAATNAMTNTWSNALTNARTNTLINAGSGKVGSIVDEAAKAGSNL